MFLRISAAISIISIVLLLMVLTDLDITDTSTTNAATTPDLPIIVTPNDRGLARVPTTYSKPEILYNQAIKLRREFGNDGENTITILTEAIDILTENIKLFPNHGHSYGLRGDILGYRQEYKAAITDLTRAVTLLPDHAYYWGLLGWFSILHGDFAIGKSASTKASQLAPNIFTWHLNIGHSYLLQGNNKMAYTFYAKVVAMDPTKKDFIDGPLNDFKIFINNGWQVAECQRALIWMEQYYDEQQIIKAIRAKKQKLGSARLTGAAKTWWQELERQNVQNAKVLLQLLQEIENRHLSMNEFYRAFRRSRATDIPGVFNYLDRSSSAGH